jgi:AP endonuclease-1
MTSFDSIVGLSYLRALHLNDSKAPFDSHRDVHANIGTGFLGLRAFHNVMNYAPFQNLPMVLETPIDRENESGKVVEDHSVWAKEIKLLESLTGMNVESEEFKTMEEELSEQGKEEREKFQAQADKKVGKAKNANGKSAKAMNGWLKGEKKKGEAERG